jgi:hypothetical protein
MVMIVECLHCRTNQKVHVAVRVQANGERHNLLLGTRSSAAEMYSPFEFECISSPLSPFALLRFIV